MSEPHRDVEEVDVDLFGELDIPDEGELDPDDTYTEGDGES